MYDLHVHPHALKHGLAAFEIDYAWENFAIRQPRGIDAWAAIGFDQRGREIEMVAVVQSDGSLLVIHAMFPTSHSMKHELGLERR